jgi:hypothetical protein
VLKAEGRTRIQIQRSKKLVAGKAAFGVDGTPEMVTVAAASLAARRLFSVVDAGAGGDGRAGWRGGGRGRIRVRLRFFRVRPVRGLRWDFREFR